MGIGIWLLSFFLLPTRLVEALPPRPIPEKTEPAETGAYIKLQVEAAPAGMWTVVQWEDANGGWHDVGGWQGTLDDETTKLWWVAPKDFGTGPFRWTAFDIAGGEMLGVSNPFNLPDKVKDVILVELVLE